MQGLPILILILIFVGAAAGVWWAGVRLSNTTDVMNRRFGMSGAFGGVVLLAVSTNLPDIAVVTSSGVRGNIDLAIGNLLGSVALQTTVLVAMDFVGGGNGKPLTSRTKTLAPVVGAMMAITALSLVLLGSQMDAMTYFRVEPIALVIFLTWIAGLFVIQRAGSGLPWNVDEHHDQESSEQPNNASESSTGKTTALFLFAALITMAGGVLLELSSSAIASSMGIRSVIFGGTILALATSIPDLSTGYQAIRLGEYQLVVTKEFGSNMFLTSLLLLAGIVSGTAVVSGIGSTSIAFAALSVVLSSIYVVGLILRDDRMVFRVGVDSLIVLVTYIIGVVVLLTAI